MDLQHTVAENMFKEMAKVIKARDQEDPHSTVDKLMYYIRIVQSVESQELVKKGKKRGRVAKKPKSKAKKSKPSSSDAVAEPIAKDPSGCKLV